jgi:hypothetical protein
LKDEGFGEFALVSGWRNGSDQSHALLEENGLIIDVISPQLEDGAGCVIINADLTWHAQFGDHRERRDDGDFRTENEPPHLSLAYEKTLPAVGLRRSRSVMGARSRQLSVFWNGLAR